MTRNAKRNHLLVLGGLLVLLGLLGMHMGVNYGWWWLLGAFAVVVHLGAFTALIAWIIRRVRGHQRDSRADGVAGG